MTTVVVLVVLVAFSFAVTRLLQRFAARFVVLSGAEYLLVGVLLGPLLPARLIDHDTIELIQPLISLLLGLIGFLVGLRVPHIEGGGPATTVGILSSSGVVLSVAALSIGLADLLGLVGGPAHSSYRVVLGTVGSLRFALEISEAQLLLGLALGASAAIASPAVIATTRARLGSNAWTGRLLSTLAETSHWVGICVAGLSLALARAQGTTDGLRLGLAAWVTVAVGLGSISGVLFSLFIGRERDPQRVFLAAVGGVIFASGVGVALDVSPLFINLVVGLTVALTSPHATAVRNEMDRLSHPLFVLTMILAGALWEPVSGAAWLFPVLYVVARLFARWLFVSAFGNALIELPPRVSRGLLAQGTAAVAIAVDFAQRVPEMSALILSTVLIGTLACELFSHRALRSLLMDVSEHPLSQESEAST